MPVVGDTVVEQNETFQVVLSAPVGATIADGSATGTITNDDTAAPPPLPTLAINDAAVAEGNSGTTPLTFTVTLSAQPGASTVTVAYATADGTANAPQDYTATSGTLTFTGTTTTQTIAVSVVGDTVVEQNETFQVVLSAPVGATIADGSATGTITNDDTAAPPPLPTLAINDAAVAEGNSGTTPLTFTVTLSAQPGASTVTVAYATANGTANAPQDYTATSGTLTFTGTTTTQTIAVSVVGDTVVEQNETFQVVLSAPVGATIADGSATGTITNDDTAAPPPLPTLAINDAAVAEGNSGTTPLTFTVTLSAQPGASTVTVAYATANGTANAPQDYTATSGTLTFSGTTTTQTISRGRRRRHEPRADRNLPGRPLGPRRRHDCRWQRHGDDHERRHGSAAVTTNARDQRRDGG